MSNSQFLMPSSVVQRGQFGDGMPVVELESPFHREPEMPVLGPQMRTNLDLGTQTPLRSRQGRHRQGRGGRITAKCAWKHAQAGACHVSVAPPMGMPSVAPRELERSLFFRRKRFLTPTAKDDIGVNAAGLCGLDHGLDSIPVPETHSATFDEKALASRGRECETCPGDGIMGWQRCLREGPRKKKKTSATQDHDTMYQPVASRRLCCCGASLCSVVVAPRVRLTALTQGHALLGRLDPLLKEFCLAPCPPQGAIVRECAGRAALLWRRRAFLCRACACLVGIKTRNPPYPSPTCVLAESATQPPPSPPPLRQHEVGRSLNNGRHRYPATAVCCASSSCEE